MQTECKKPSLLEIFAEVQPILYKNASKIKANLELHKSLDDFYAYYLLQSACVIVQPICHIVIFCLSFIERVIDSFDYIG